MIADRQYPIFNAGFSQARQLLHLWFELSNISQAYWQDYRFGFKKKKTRSGKYQLEFSSSAVEVYCKKVRLSNKGNF